MSIEEKVKKYIPKDSKVKISSDGLIGNKIIVIYGGTPGSPSIEENSKLAVTATLNPEEMLTTLQSNNQNLLAITNNFKILSDKLVSGKGSIGKLFKDETLYNDLQSTMRNLTQTTNNAKNIGNDLAEYTAKLSTKGTLAGDLVSDTVIFSQLRATTAEMNEVAAKSNGVVEQLSRATSQLNNSNSPVGTLLYDESVANDLKSTLKSLQSASIKLDENMEALQHNFLLRGFFQKKAKQQKK